MIEPAFDCSPVMMRVFYFSLFRIWTILEGPKWARRLGIAEGCGGNTEYSQARGGCFVSPVESIGTGAGAGASLVICWAFTLGGGNASTIYTMARGQN